MASIELRRIGILLFPGVEELDAIGPWEVLAYWCKSFPDDGWTASCFSATGGRIACAKGLVIEAHHSFADCPPLDVLVHPGGQGTRVLLADQAHLDWVRAQRRDVALLTAVCTGSLIYAAAGLLGPPACHHPLGVSRPARRAGPDHRGAARRPLRR